MGRALVFPGQGSQTIGMGQELADAFPTAREIFEEVDDALNRRLSHIMWEGPMDLLTQTANAQPALMAHSMAMFSVLEKEAGLDLKDYSFCAGHSLGEYSALCASGSISLSEAAKLLRVRGDAMQSAAVDREGAMAAILGVDVDAVEKMLSLIDSEGVCKIANDNAPGQIVISGDRSAVEGVAASAKEHGAKMAKLLPVSGAFHSPLMESAAEKMRDALASASITVPKVPVVSNVSAEVFQDVEQIRSLLVEQVTGRVRWTESVEHMIGGGVHQFVEVGTGKVLSGLIKRVNRDASVIAVSTPADLDVFAKF